VIVPRLTMFLRACQLFCADPPFIHFPQNVSEEDAATYLSPAQLVF